MKQSVRRYQAKALPGGNKLSEVYEDVFKSTHVVSWTSVAQRDNMALLSMKLQHDFRFDVQGLIVADFDECDAVIRSKEGEEKRLLEAQMDAIFQFDRVSNEGCKIVSELV